MRTIVVGTGITKFGYLDASARQLAASAVGEALDEVAGAGTGFSDDAVELVVVGNAAAGILTGQEMIRAQTTLATSRLVGVPALAVENVCASSSSAFLVGCMAIESGMHDVVMIVGVEKMSGTDRSLPNRALATAMDVEVATPDPDSPVFMEHYAGAGARYMARSGATARDFATVAAKNLRNGSMNAIAQVLGASTPTRCGRPDGRRPVDVSMCSSIADGAAVALLMSNDAARRFDVDGPRVLGIATASGRSEPLDKTSHPSSFRRASPSSGPGSAPTMSTSSRCTTPLRRRSSSSSSVSVSWPPAMVRRWPEPAIWLSTVASPSIRRAG